MILEMKLIATVVIMFGSAAMICARRLDNKNSDAGAGIAGWTIILLLNLWWGTG